MQTIYLVGHAAEGTLARQLDGAGFYVLPADNAETAMAMLSAVCADAFVIDVGSREVGGERLIERLGKIDPWRRLPIVATGARPAQHQRLSRSASVREVIPSCERGVEAVLAAVRRLMHGAEPAAPFDDVPGRHAWSAASGEVTARTLRRWISADAAERNN